MSPEPNSCKAAFIGFYSIHSNKIVYVVVNSAWEQNAKVFLGDWAIWVSEQYVHAVDVGFI